MKIECFFAFLLKENLFQECEGSLKHKTELITKLEAKTLSMTETIQKMDEKYVYLSFISVSYFISTTDSSVLG